MKQDLKVRIDDIHDRLEMPTSASKLLSDDQWDKLIDLDGDLTAQLEMLQGFNVSDQVKKDFRVSLTAMDKINNSGNYHKAFEDATGVSIFGGM